MAYVDGFLLAVPKKKMQAYLREARKDPRMQPDPKTMPFDVKRMAYGGFKVVVQS